MSVGKSLREKRERLKQIEVEATTLRLEIEVLEKAARVLRGERLESLNEFGTQPSRGRPRGRRAGSVDPDSIIGRAISLLREVNEPRHVDSLLAALREQGVDAKKQSLVSALAKLAKTGRVVYRVTGRPSTFALLEWDAEPSVRMEGVDQAANMTC